MSCLSKTIRAIGNKRRIKKELKAMSNMEPSGVVKGAASSNTTQNVLAGGVAGGGAVLIGLSALRSWAPNLIPWSPEHDAELVVFATTILVPFVSRAIAFWRQPAKAGK
jgi:hypothetical protein